LSQAIHAKTPAPNRCHATDAATDAATAAAATDVATDAATDALPF
jgi:hypothetical protein